MIVGSYADDEPGSPWRVAMFVDESVDQERQKDLADVFLGRIPGDTRKLYGRAIKEVSMVRPAAIELVHVPGRWRIAVETFVEVRSTIEAVAEGPVTCGLTDHASGVEMISDVLTVTVPPFEWSCGSGARSNPASLTEGKPRHTRLCSVINAAGHPVETICTRLRPMIRHAITVRPVLTGRDVSQRFVGVGWLCVWQHQFNEFAVDPCRKRLRHQATCHEGHDLVHDPGDDFAFAPKCSDTCLCHLARCFGYPDLVSLHGRGHVGLDGAGADNQHVDVC